MIVSAGGIVVLMVVFGPKLGGVRLMPGGGSVPDGSGTFAAQTVSDPPMRRKIVSILSGAVGFLPRD